MKYMGSRLCFPTTIDVLDSLRFPELTGFILFRVSVRRRKFQSHRYSGQLQGMKQAFGYSVVRYTQGYFDHAGDQNDFLTNVEFLSSPSRLRCSQW